MALKLLTPAVVWSPPRQQPLPSACATHQAHTYHTARLGLGDTARGQSKTRGGSSEGQVQQDSVTAPPWAPLQTCDTAGLCSQPPSGGRLF